MCNQAIDAPLVDSVPKLCSLTKRVMIVSPQPERVNRLLVSLTAACCDVFCLHELDEGLFASLKPELVIYDALPIVHAGERSSLLQQHQATLRSVRRIGIPLVLLMDEQAHREQGAIEPSEGLQFIWPADADQVVEQMHELLNMQEGTVNLQDMLLFKDLQVDLKRRLLTQDDERIELTKTEYDLLVHFLTSDGSVQTRELLLDVIWGLQFYTSSNVVDVHIKSLRKKLGDSAVDPKYIITVRGAGYRLAQ